MILRNCDAVATRFRRVAARRLRRGKNDRRTDARFRHWAARPSQLARVLRHLPMRPIRRHVFDEAMLVRLFRLWSMARESGEPPLPAMHHAAMQVGYAVETAAACSSLFELAEARLGRRLVRECCCSVSFSTDERALIGVVRTARGDAIPRADDAATRGIDEAIGWAARAVRTAMKVPGEPSAGETPKSSGGRRASSAPVRIARHAR